LCPAVVGDETLNKNDRKTTRIWHFIFKKNMLCKHVSYNI